MLRNFIVSSPCFEFGVALPTGHDLLKSIKRPARKARLLLARRTTLFEIDRSNDLLSDRDAKLLLRRDALSRKLLEPRWDQSPPASSLWGVGGVMVNQKSQEGFLSRGASLATRDLS